MLLAELIVRHTRRHMPTRRVALESAYLPTSGPAHGVALLAGGDGDEPARDRRRRARAAHRGSSTTRAAGCRSRASRCGTGCSATCTASTGPGIGCSVRTARSCSRSTRTARRSRRCSARCWARPGCRHRAARSRSTRCGQVVAGPLGRSLARCRGAVRRARHVGLPAPAAGGGRGEWQPGGPPDEAVVAGRRRRPALGDGGARPARGHGRRPRRREPPLPAAAARRASRQRGRRRARPRRASPSSPKPRTILLRSGFVRGCRRRA